MEGLIRKMEAFNRRERFFVVGWALDNPRFTLGERFREQVGRDIRLDIPATAFCAMDFSTRLDDRVPVGGPGGTRHLLGPKYEDQPCDDDLSSSVLSDTGHFFLDHLTP